MEASESLYTLFTFEMVFESENRPTTPTDYGGGEVGDGTEVVASGGNPYTRDFGFISSVVLTYLALWLQCA